jgi:hypothetical protein
MKRLLALLILRLSPSNWSASQRLTVLAIGIISPVALIVV